MREYSCRRESAEILRQRAARTPDYNWEILPSAPVARFDAGLVQVGPLLYCIGGYNSQVEVLSSIDVFNMQTRRWHQRIALPGAVPQTHFALCCEKNRFLYCAGGQLGPRCCPAIANVFCLDLKTGVWRTLPPLPAPRYAATMQIFENRLHVIGGAHADRYTPAVEHWSLVVGNGKALQSSWQVEAPIPRGGMHRASAVCNGELYVLGGQEGDFTPVHGDPLFTCNPFTHEDIYGDTFCWNGETRTWDVLPPMPIATSHVEFSVVTHGDFIIVAGGSHFKCPETFDIELTDAVQIFDTKKRRWEIGGYLPYRTKTCLAGIDGDWLYIALGQRDAGPHDPRPGKVEVRTWRTALRF